MPRIILAGQDIHLLETRAEVLKRTGAEIAYCIGSQALNVVASSAPDLLVLCHSLPYGQAEAIANGARLSCPKTKVLLVVSELIDDRSFKSEKFDAVSLPDPPRLIARATELLQRPPHYMRQMEHDTQGPEAL